MSGALAALPERAAAIRRVFLGLLAANLAVVAIKASIGASTGSLAVIGDAIHSSADAFNNLLFVALTRLAGQAPDHDHPYGHTKYEVVGALAILVFLSVASFELLKSAVQGLRSGAAPPDFTAVQLAVLAGSLGVNSWVAWYETRRGRELQSDLLLADAAHTRADVLITIGVLAGAALSRQGIRYVDPVIAIAVAMMIVRLGWGIFRGIMPVLMDEVAREPDQVRRAAESVEGVRSAYAIKSRSAAGVVFAELTIGVNGEITVARAHTIADAVENRLREELGLTEVTVHIEPC